MVVRGNFLKIQWKTLIICLIIPLAVGIISAFLTRNNMETFDLINKPFLAPPSWLFPVVWTILYILMGLVLLWLLVIKTTILFYQISKLAGYLMIPYLLWVTFAGYLNFSIYLLN